MVRFWISCFSNTGIGYPDIEQKNLVYLKIVYLKNDRKTDRKIHWFPFLKHATLSPIQGVYMSTVIKNLPNLNEAIQNANEIFCGKGYTVAATNEQVNPKEPVFLQLRFTNGTVRNIGITHLVHLAYEMGDGWDDKSFEAVARTTDQVMQAIIARVALFFNAEAQGLYIDENGTIFDFNNSNVKLYENKTFSVDDVVVSYEGAPLLLSRIKSEGIIKFIKLENWHTQLFDSVDLRKGKGIFIDTTGKIYRA